MKYLRLSFLLCVTCCLPLCADATHIVGGELNYRYLGNNKYEVRLTVYRDCYNGVPPFDNPAALGIFDSANNLVGSKLMVFQGLDTVKHYISSPCLIPPANVCYEVTTYTDTINLPPIPGGYQLAYQRCCRNYTILNIINPDNTGATYYAHVPDTSVVAADNNPVFKKWPPTFICANVPFEFDHSATDYDGDSIVYELYVPFTGATPNFPMPQPPNNPPYVPVTWQGSYSLSNVLGGVAMKIDPQTGKLTATPNTIGQFVYGVKAKEYRNGVLIGETLRDFQVNVVPCQNIVVASIQSPLITCGSNTAAFTNNSYGAASYTWTFGDPTTNNDTSSLANPSYTYPDTGYYNVRLIAYSGINPDCNDTSYGVVHLLPAFDDTLLFDVDVCKNLVSFRDSAMRFASGTPNAWLWKFGDGDSAKTQTPQHTYADGAYTVTLSVATSEGCADTIRAPLIFGKILDPAINVSADCQQTCNGSATVTTTGGLPPYFYLWSNGQTGATASGLCPGNYAVTVTDAGNCTASDSTTVQISTLTAAVTASAETDTLYDGGSVQLHALPSTEYNYQWTPAAPLNNPGIADPIATLDATTTFTVEITDGVGCKKSDIVTVYIMKIYCDEKDVYVPNAFTPDYSGKNDILYVRSRVIQELYLAIYNRWGEKVFETTDLTKGWDGTYKGKRADPDVYVYYLRARCIRNGEYFKKGNITLIR